MEFKKYMHIERLGNTEVDDIQMGECFVFPKIDGTNASVWMDDKHNIQAGSRNRELTLDDDNGGFLKAMLSDERILKYLEKYPDHRLHGEWLISHTLKTYRDEAWRHFYIFDISVDVELEKPENMPEEMAMDYRLTMKYLPFETYKEWLDEFDLDFIYPLAVVKNADEEMFLKLLDQNTYLIKDGEGSGEGIVIKNYDYTNKYGRTTFAKIVKTEFKENARKAFGYNSYEKNNIIEEGIATKYCTPTLIEKTYAKIVTDNDGWSSKCIPRLLETVYHDLVAEEIWEIVKKHKNPTINFKTLKAFCTLKIKECKSELF